MTCFKNYILFCYLSTNLTTLLKAYYEYNSYNLMYTFPSHFNLLMGYFKCYCICIHNYFCWLWSSCDPPGCLSLIVFNYFGILRPNFDVCVCACVSEWFPPHFQQAILRHQLCPFNSDTVY